MKHAILLSVGAIFLSPAVAMAQSLEQGPSGSAQGQVNIAGDVARLCALGAPSVINIDLGQLIDTSGARVGRLTSLADREVSLPAFCNYAGARLSVTSQALVPPDETAPPAGFARAVNFSANVGGWASAPADVTTAANADGSNRSASGFGGVHGAPKAGELTLALSNFAAPADAYLVAGAYSGTVTITLGPGDLD